MWFGQAAGQDLPEINTVTHLSNLRLASLALPETEPVLALGRGGCPRAFGTFGCAALSSHRALQVRPTKVEPVAKCQGSRATCTVQARVGGGMGLSRWGQDDSRVSGGGGHQELRPRLEAPALLDFAEVQVLSAEGQSFRTPRTLKIPIPS